jgi:heat shock protein HslJ
MTTRKHCAEPDGIMEQEQHYLQALARAHAYTLKPDRLELRDRDGSLQVSFRVQEN